MHEYLRKNEKCNINFNSSDFLPGFDFLNETGANINLINHKYSKSNSNQLAVNQ